MIEYKIFSNDSIKLSRCCITVSELLSAVKSTNERFKMLQNRSRTMSLDIFEVLDFRVLSGMVGEVFARELALTNPNLKQNPNIDGYPDLVQTADVETSNYFQTCKPIDFIAYRYGGLEVKNTFGTKKSGSNLQKGHQRINGINKKLDWKAHHRQTNYLLALFADYIDNVPTIAAVCYSDALTPDDWNVKQEPKEGSAMTSFSAISTSGFGKLKTGLKICLNTKDYVDFFTD